MTNPKTKNLKKTSLFTWNDTNKEYEAWEGKVQGNAVEDEAAAGNPVLAGGRYDSTARSLDTGDVGAMALYADGGLLIKDFSVEVAMGRVPGYTKVNKFGEAIDADSGIPTDLWDGADGSTSTDIWAPPKAARVHNIVSTSDVDSDTGGAVAQGAGARTVQVYGLTSWTTAETSEVVVMDGTDGTDTSSSYVIIHRIKALTWGANGVNTGVITAVAATDGTVTAAILAGQNQTQMMIYGIPSTQQLQIKHLQAEIVKTTGATQRGDCELLMMTDPATNVVDNTAWTNKENFLVVEAASPWTHPYEPPKSCSGPCIVKMQVTTNTNGTKVIGAMDAYIVTI